MPHFERDSGDGVCISRPCPTRSSPRRCHTKQARRACPQPVALAPVLAGADHTAGVTAAGHLLTWGNGQQGQLGRVGERMSDRVKMETLLTPHPVPFKRVR